MNRKWVLLVACSVALLLGGCRSEGKGETAMCRPSAEVAEAPSPGPVRQVAVYWDISGSMAPYLNDGTGALGALLSDLDRRWARQAGLSVDRVTHLAVGEGVRPLPGPPRPRDLTARWSNLPAATHEIAARVASEPDLAAILVSDLQVEVPSVLAGRPLCGEVLGPTGGGAVPSLFAKCLGEAWKDGAPEFLQVQFVRVHSYRSNGVRPAKAASARAPASRGVGSPLFAAVFARDPGFAQRFSERLVADLPPAGEPSALALVDHRPVVDCGALERCGFRTRSDLILRGEAATALAPCDFVAAGARAAHRMRCALVDSPEPHATLVIPQVGPPAGDGDGEETRIQAALPRPGTDTAAASALFDLSIGVGSEGRSVARGVRFTARWSTRTDSRERLVEWLGEDAAPGASYPLPDLFEPLAQTLELSLPQPMCDRRWVFHYAR